MAQRIVHIERKGELYQMTLDTYKDTLLATDDYKKYYAHKTKSGESHFYSCEDATFENKTFHEIKVMTKESAMDQIAKLPDDAKSAAFNWSYKPKEL